MSQFSTPIEASILTIEKRDPELHAFIYKRLNEARIESVQSHTGVLAGLPFSLKDVWDVEGLPTTGGSHRFKNHIAALDGKVMRAFRATGAILMGKTSLSDLSVAPEAANYIVGYTRNPYDLARTSGGSSGGAAVAVATQMVEWDWGSDIGGSIRLPAAFCGVLGMRLSTKNWPVEGIFPPIPSSLKSMCGQGPLTRDVAPMRAVLGAVGAALSEPITQKFAVEDWVIWRPEIGGEWPDFEAEVGAFLAHLTGKDCVTEPTLPSLRQTRNLYLEMWSAHFKELFASDKSLSIWGAVSAVLSAVFLRGKNGDRRIFPSTAELFLGMMLAHFTVFRSPARADRKLRDFRDKLEAIWSQGRIIVLPTSLYSAPKLGMTTRNPHILTCVIPANLGDAAALSVPFGHFANGLPRGLQLMGPPGSETLLLDWAEKIMAAQK